MQLVHSDTLAVKPIITTDVLGNEETTPQLTGHGIIELLPIDYSGQLNIGDTVYYNSLAGQYINQLDLVVCNLDSVLLISKGDKQQ